LSWNGTAWENLNRQVWTFDSSNNIVSATYSEWKNGSWSDRSITLWSYDINNDMTHWFVQDWDTVSASWKNFLQAFLTYDSTSKIVSYTKQIWNGTTVSWENNDSTRYYYHNLSAGIHTDAALQDIAVYPNPATDYIYIHSADANVEEIRLLNSSGQLLLTQSGNGNTSMVKLPPRFSGTCFILIFTDKGILSKQIVRE
jgi:hypothetical protein